MAMHGGGWWSYLSASEEKPKVTPALMRRVLTYSKPYRWQILWMLILILAGTGLTLLTPLLLRTLIDTTIPGGRCRSADLDFARFTNHPGIRRRDQRISEKVECQYWRGSDL